MKTLYVADSVGHTASVRNLEKFSKSRIRTARAYSSVYDVNARWPKDNFSDVVDFALKNPGCDNFDVVVLSAPTVDITNMDTSNMAPNSAEIYKQKAVLSSKNMFNTALRSLKQHPNLYKLVIFEHPPRFDTPRTAPVE